METEEWYDGPVRVRFSSVQNGTHALGETHTHSVPPQKSPFPPPPPFLPVKHVPADDRAPVLAEKPA